MLFLYHGLLLFCFLKIIFLNMNSVILYENYRAYIQDYYSEHHERFGFTWRRFAKAAGYSSPVFLKLVSEGKSNLSDLGIERTAQAMGLVGNDLLYFRVLVHFNQEKKASVKKSYYNEMRAIASKSQVSLVGEDQYDYFSSWRNPVLRELADSLKGLSPSDYASLFVEKTTPEEVKKALKILLKTGLMTQPSPKEYEKTEAALSTGNLEVASLTIRDMHRQMGELAVKSLDDVDPQERDFSGLTFGVTEEAVERIKAEIADFRHRIMSIVLEDKGFDRVLRLNMQLFPLTKPAKKKRETQ